MDCYKAIPQELKDLNQWVCAFDDNKIPQKAFAHARASSTNPSTWSDYNVAFNSVKRGIYDHLGFVFNDNGYVAIDIDAGFDEYGLMSALSADIVGRCKSYTEKSKSGRGFHIILKGNLPFNGKNNLNGVEIYKTARYFIMTGKTLLYKDIIENQEAIDYIVDKYFKDVRTSKTKKSCLQSVIYVPDWSKSVDTLNRRVKLRPLYPPILKGCRNISLTSLAGSMYQTGYDIDDIFDELCYVNKVACDTPLNETELINICKSISKYERGKHEY